MTEFDERHRRLEAEAVAAQPEEINVGDWVSGYITAGLKYAPQPPMTENTGDISPSKTPAIYAVVGCGLHDEWYRDCDACWNGLKESFDNLIDLAADELHASEQPPHRGDAGLEAIARSTISHLKELVANGHLSTDWVTGQVDASATKLEAELDALAAGQEAAGEPRLTFSTEGSDTPSKPCSRYKGDGALCFWYQGTTDPEDCLAHQLPTGERSCGLDGCLWAKFPVAAELGRCAECGMWEGKHTDADTGHPFVRPAQPASDHEHIWSHYSLKPRQKSTCMVKGCGVTNDEAAEGE